LKCDFPNVKKSGVYDGLFDKNSISQIPINRAFAEQ
jgi:hypothetical protein